MGEPRMVNAQLALAEAWLLQLFDQHWQVQHNLARCNMVGAALQVRDVFPDAAYVVFEASDQGAYNFVAGAADTRFVDYADPDYLLPDSAQWEFRDDVLDVWQPFLVPAPNTEHGGMFYLDIEKVLAEVEVPWQPPKVSVPGGTLVPVVTDPIPTGVCAECGGDIEYDGVEWWHSRIETFEHVARRKDGD